MQKNGNMTQNFFNNEFILKVINKHKKLLIILSIITIIVSAAATFLIEPLYRAQAVFFPIPISSVGKAALSTNSNKDIMEIGDEEVVEQFLQILHSDYIRHYIVKKYDLMKRYHIDTTSKYPLTKLYKKYKDRITFSKTRYLSIEINVLDPDPQKSAQIANEIMNLVDTVANNMQYKRSKLIYLEVKKNLENLEDEIYNIVDSLSNLGNKGLVDYESQSRALMEAYGKAILENKKDLIIKLKSQIDTIAKYGPLYKSLMNYLDYQREQLSLLRTKYIEAKANLDLKIPYKYVVSRAEVPEKKAYPIRWLIVLISLISIITLTIIIIIFIEKNK